MLPNAEKFYKYLEDKCDGELVVIEDQRIGLLRLFEVYFKEDLLGKYLLLQYPNGQFSCCYKGRIPGYVKEAQRQIEIPPYDIVCISWITQNDWQIFSEDKTTRLTELSEKGHNFRLDYHRSIPFP